LRRLESDGAT